MVVKTVARSNSQPCISRDFSLVDHTLPTRPEPAWQKMAQSPLNGTTHSVDIEEEGRNSTMDRQWLNKADTKRMEQHAQSNSLPTKAYALPNKV